MRVTSLLTAVALVASSPSGLAQGRVFAPDKLPAASIELNPSEPPLPPTPWQLPKPGDPLYDATKEAETQDAAHTHTVHVFERGIFKGYASLTSSPAPERHAKEMGDVFAPNPKLPPDTVELSASAQPNPSNYFPTRPKTRPANIPADCIAVRVFHGGKQLGWTFMPKKSVVLLHQRK